MTRYNSVNVKLYNSQLNKLKSTTKNPSEVSLKLSSNMVCDSNGEINFPHKLLTTERQISKLPKDFANNLLANIKLSITQLSKIDFLNHC